MLNRTPLAGSARQSINRGEGPSSIQFTPERIVAAIAFHLIDEGIAISVAPQSTKRTLNRLRQQSFTWTISSRLWAKMSNLQRLRRLLEESHTDPSFLGGGIASLAHRSR